MTVYICRRAKWKFNLKVYYEDARNFMLCVIAVLSLIALGLFTACMVLDSRYKRVNIEAGEYFSAEDIFGDGARFGSDFDGDCINHAGVYYFSVSTGDGERTVRLSVKDTKAPEVTVKDVSFAVGGEFPHPEDFIESIYEPDDYTGEYLSELPKLKSPGEHEMKVRFSDASGNKTEVFTVKMRQIYDNEPPKLDVSELIVCEVGGTLEYKPYITLTDNCIGELSFDVDESGLDLSSAGEYTVYVTGKDGVGNKTEKIPVTVNVVERYDENELEAMLDGMLDEIAAEGKSGEDICRAVYELVRKSIIYTGGSEKGDVKRAAYRALIGGGGDCYSFFAVSKLLFERCGIESLDVSRLSCAEGEHYWNLVNIGGEGGDRWYHFDATPLRADKYDHSGCLLTEKQIDAYSSVRRGFYIYDRDMYPTVSNEIITPTPRLEELY